MNSSASTESADAASKAASNAANIVYRRGTMDDMRPVQQVFRNSLYDLLHRTGVFSVNRPTEAEMEDNWQRRKGLYEHLTTHADQYWVAEQAGEIIGYARSLLDDAGKVRELTEFFVAPGVQSSGVGRELLSRAFPSDEQITRFIIATGDARAQARYLKSGVYPRFVNYEMSRAPEVVPVPAEIDVQPMTLSDETLALLAEIDALVIGQRRDSQHRWLLADRPGYFYRVGEQLIGYGYVGKDDQGPFALRDPQWFPAVLAHAETEAARLGSEEFLVNVPSVNETAIQYCLGRGFHIFPFIMYVMTNRPFGQFDRYIITEPALVM